MGSEEERNKEIVRRFFEEVVNAGDAERAGEFMAEDLRSNDAIPVFPPGIEGFKMAFAAARMVFPDRRETIEQMVAEGDTVVVRMTTRQTQDGDLLDIPASGKQVTIQGISILRLEDGKIVETWGMQDDLGLFRQLGRIPKGLLPEPG
jgi:steroid delta-isomerase-like uncharacterized protein